MKLQMLFTLPKMVNSFWYRTKPSHVVNWRENSVTRETPLPTNGQLNPHHPSRISLARHRFLTHPILQLGELLLDKHVIDLSLDAIDFQDDCFLLLVVVILFFLLHLDSANCLFQQKQERRRRMRRRLCFFSAFMVATTMPSSVFVTPKKTRAHARTTNCKSRRGGYWQNRPPMSRNQQQRLQGPHSLSETKKERECLKQSHCKTDEW